MTRWSCLFLAGVLAACGGAGESPVAGGASDSTTPPPSPSPQPQLALPPVEGEVIGLPGSDVPGLDATYVVTEPGWLGADGAVVFEAVLRFTGQAELACGIFRMAPDGLVHPLVLQRQLLPDTGGGRVIHPRLPLVADGATIVIPTDIDGGDIVRGLFAVPKDGGTPKLLAGLHAGEFVAAVITADGTVVAEVTGAAGHEILVIAPDTDPVAICSGCEPGFGTDGERVVVRKQETAWSVEFDGVATPLVAAGDPAPETAGSVSDVRAAWIQANGDVIVHALTDDPARPDLLLRLDGAVEAVAVCGAAAPGTAGTFGRFFPARGDGDDVVFGAFVEGDPAHLSGVYCVPPGGAPEALALDGDAAADIDATLFVQAHTTVTDHGRTAFAALLEGEDGVEGNTGVFVQAAGSLGRVVTTGAPVAALARTSVVAFMHPLQQAVHVRSDGRTLVHVGLREERRPDATLGALILVR